jgi:hypothetical protein
MAKAATAVRNESAVGEIERRIGNQRDGAHRGEMMRNDGNRQQAGCSQRVRGIVAARGDKQR